MRLLLLLPTRGYRADAFVEAASRLGAELTIAMEEPSTLESLNPDGLITVDFARPEEGLNAVLQFHRQHPIGAVVGVDDSTTLLQAAIGSALGLPTNPVASVAAARNKHRMREILRENGLPGPGFQLHAIESSALNAAGTALYPCVLKPLVVSGSRGVIRANNPAEFTAAFQRIGKILRDPEIASLGESARQILVEEYLPGPEFALEGILLSGSLQVLALFDKPEPLEGPFFEETLYLTPSRLSQQRQTEAAELVDRACTALGLIEGPVHAELRLTPLGFVPVEVNPRPIGGRCSRALKFQGNLTLEEIILRRALGMDIPSFQRESGASGVMMIPVPRGGVFRSVRGQEAALQIPHITEVSINVHRGQPIIPLPEGSTYLGFIFARAKSPEAVENALRQAHRELDFDIS